VYLALFFVLRRDFGRMNDVYDNNIVSFVSFGTYRLKIVLKRHACSATYKVVKRFFPQELAKLQVT